MLHDTHPQHDEHAVPDSGAHHDLPAADVDDANNPIANPSDGRRVDLPAFVPDLRSPDVQQDLRNALRTLRDSARLVPPYLTYNFGSSLTDCSAHFLDAAEVLGLGILPFLMTTTADAASSAAAAPPAAAHVERDVLPKWGPPVVAKRQVPSAKRRQPRWLTCGASKDAVPQWVAGVTAQIARCCEDVASPVAHVRNTRRGVVWATEHDNKISEDLDRAGAAIDRSRDLLVRLTAALQPRVAVTDAAQAESNFVRLVADIVAARAAVHLSQYTRLLAVTAGVPLPAQLAVRYGVRPAADQVRQPADAADCDAGSRSERVTQPAAATAEPSWAVPSASLATAVSELNRSILASATKPVQHGVSADDDFRPSAPSLAMNSDGAFTDSIDWRAVPVTCTQAAVAVFFALADAVHMADSDDGTVGGHHGDLCGNDCGDGNVAAARVGASLGLLPSRVPLRSAVAAAAHMVSGVVACGGMRAAWMGDRSTRIAVYVWRDRQAWRPDRVVSLGDISVRELQWVEGSSAATVELHAWVVKNASGARSWSLFGSQGNRIVVHTHNEHHAPLC